MQSYVKELVNKLFYINSSDVLFLYRSVDVNVLILRLIAIDSDALFENQFNAFFPYPMAEVYQFRSFAGFFGYKLLLPSKVLVIIVFTPLFHHAFIR